MQSSELHQSSQVTRILLVAWWRNKVQDQKLRENCHFQCPVLGSRRRYKCRSSVTRCMVLTFVGTFVSFTSGKRCVVEDCMRQAYERTNNLCTNHYQEQ